MVGTCLWAVHDALAPNDALIRSFRFTRPSSIVAALPDMAAGATVPSRMINAMLGSSLA